MRPETVMFDDMTFARSSYEPYFLRKAIINVSAIKPNPTHATTILKYFLVLLSFSG
jgi:hypothetical protein